MTQIKMHGGIVRTLIYVRHVSEFNKKFISLGMLDSNRYTNKSKSRVIRISKGALNVIKWQKINDLYTL